MQDTIVIIAYNSHSPYENHLAHVVEDARDGFLGGLVRCMICIKDIPNSVTNLIRFAWKEFNVSLTEQ